jgi:hypothetical protein
MAPPPFQLARLLGEVWRLYRVLFGALVAAALIVFVPVSLVDAVAGPFSEVGDDARAGEVAGALAIGVAGAAFSLLGAVVYAGIVSVIVSHYRGLHEHPLRQELKSLPYLRLVAADLAYLLVIALGAVLLIVPGLVFMTWFALIAPAIEYEKRTVAGAMRRSRELVRPHFWKLFVLVVPLSLGSELVAGLLSEGAIAVFGEGFAGDWAGSVAGEVITAPFLALVVVLAFLELSRER